MPEQSYTYDALYRLIIATGREQIGTATFGLYDNYNDNAWMGISQPGNDNNCQNYIQQYAYDEVGNIQTLQHIADAGSYTRTYNYDTASNKLLNTVVGSYTYTNTYDARGNIVSMPHLSSITFNADNYMSTADLGGGGDAYYQYSGGQRGRKTIVNGAITEERIYLGSYEVYRKYISSVLEIERTTVHISDDTGRIAMLEVLTQGDDGSNPYLTRYVYNNHISTATLELDGSANIISYEEYHPYGTTSYQAMNATINAVAKRYRFTGKERDEENGFYYIGARYYAPWLTRWMACDPINSELYNYNKGQQGRNAGRDYMEFTASSYEYCYANPVRFVDLVGEQASAAIVLNEVHVTAEKKSTFWSKLGSFGKGLLKGALVTAAVVGAIALVAATGGVGAAVIAPALTYVAGAVGTLALVKTSADVITGKDVLTGKKLTTDQRYEEAGSIVGGIVAGGAAAKLSGTPAEPPPTESSGTNTSGSNISETNTSTNTNSIENASDSKAPAKSLGNIVSKEIWVTKSTVNAIYQHLSSLGFEKLPENVIMLERLNKIANGEMKATEIDVNFFSHETRESELMKEGMNYKDAHEQTLIEQNMYHPGYDEKLYTKEALKAGNDALHNDIMKK